ncbi:hypothetical protein [Neobacillus citreus]|uniref:Uncharacterized protein n=1 Tax=Neobacillus citreus TaxID=2833578 RepID=A0A942T325_9BACI|nr:hypothetical protein [Neobacillus citreus]MCH6267802.1 hypothetical protein [Neobacillus citreus]
MFENFEVNHLFEDSVLKHPHFSLSIDGHEYKGMVKDEKIHWYQPHPKQKIEEEHLSAVESQVYDMMQEHLE